MKESDFLNENIKKEWLFLLQNSSPLGFTNEQIKVIVETKIKYSKNVHG